MKFCIFNMIDLKLTTLCKVRIKIFPLTITKYFILKIIATIAGYFVLIAQTFDKDFTSQHI